MKILAIIPCYNEEGSLKNTVENFRAKNPDIDFVVVNDGSNDNTYKLCIENKYPVIDIPFNLGLSNAIQTGMCYAYNNEYEMALQFDGDGQHNPDYISEMIKKMQDTSADIVIGSRYLHKGSLSLRGFGKRIIRVAIKITTKKNITDPTSGMRLFNREMIKKFALNINHGPEPDTLAYLINQGMIVVEIPVVMWERKAGKSYLSALTSMLYMLRMIVSIIFIQWFRVKEN